MDNDDELFRRELGDVKPLKKTNRVQLPKTRRDDASFATARRVAEGESAQDATANPAPFVAVSDDYVEPVEPTAQLSFKRPGVQDGVFRKFRLGKYPIEGRLDLHRKTVPQARQEVYRFFAEAMQHDARTLIILHGKGQRSIERQAVIKSHLVKWLVEHPDVMAFHSAQQQHGGTGAVYVMLRKSERAKEKTRENLGRRG